MAEITDMGAVIMDEIALEGLDGITIEGLFVRLKERPEFTTSLNDAYKQYIWDNICNFNEIGMFELPHPRKPLVIFNRYDYMDSELGIVLEPEVLPEEIYPHAPIDDRNRGIRGSCALYKERVSVYRTASQLSLQEVLDRWGSKLVIVASQKMRNLALMGSSVDPELELTILQYCILERVGRSRHLGEVTQGRVSLQITGEDPKALFYHRKYLMKHGLVMKQIHHQKSGAQNCSGSLLHLPRFYVERWPKVLFLTKRVVEILRGCNNYLADYEEIRKKLGLTNSLRKLFQTTYFQRFVRTDLRLPYRHLYPDAKENEWRSFNSMKEKMIRVIQLLDPNADVDVMSTRDEDFDMDDEEQGSREEFSVTLNRSFLSQAYQVVEGGGVNGYSQMQLVQKMGLPKLSARTVSRNLLKRGVASAFMNDVGRQRVSRFRARKWDQQCTRIQTIERDIQHMRAELLSKALGAGHEIPSGAVPPTSVNQKNPKSKKRQTEVSVDELKFITESTQVVKPGSDSNLNIPSSKIPRIEEQKSGELSSSSQGNTDTAIVSAASTYSETPLYCSLAKEAMRKCLQHQSKDAPVMTYRIFKRINMILEYVKIHKVVDDHAKFLKLISEEEAKEGLNMRIDKKSLLRLLIRLKEDGRLKLHSYLLTDGVKVKTMIFICEHNVALDHPAIVSAIEQAKMKLFIVNRESINLAVAVPGEKIALHQKTQNRKQKMTFVYDKKIGRKYGFCPKFIRMRTLHQFLFYLVYGYEGDANLDQNLVVPFLESKDIVVDDSLHSEMTQMYVLDVHWRMFIPPLPEYTGGPKGWSIMCDLLLRLPLSLFVRIFNVCYVVVGLNEYLQHPVRRHFLVRQLPVPMQNGLMAFRKYIFSIHEVLQRLCYIGLVQFGPQRLKEKDQVLIYLNRRTNLLDTVSSKPGYHQISEEEYPEIKYEFKTLQDIDAYWYNLWNICINTQLGGRMCVQGKDIVLEHLAFKPAMLEALQPVRPSRAPGRDTGVVPGDRRGAAGLDSAIFAHLKRNWNWSNITTKSDISPKKVDRRKYRIMNLKAAPVVFTKSAIIVKRSINYLQKGRFSALRNERRSHTIPPGAEVLPKGQKRKQNVVRRIEARKTKVSRKPFYDDVDLKALQLMSKLRVEWSTEEDTLLLLCKVASVYLCPNPRQQTISLSTVRDVLHSCIPEAQNKTSRACQRRILYMLKNLATSNNLAMHLEELKQDEDICERFGKPEVNVRGNLESAEEYETRIHEKFRLLVSELQERSDRMVTTTGTYCSTIPDRADDFWKLFDVVEPKTVIKSKGAFQDVKNIVDIHCSVVNSIIHSSLCSTTDKTSWAFQLFRVYQQYPDSLLRAAMGKLRQDLMVSLKKSYTRHKQKGNYLPLSSSPYQLSVSYLQLIQTKYQYGVFHESYLMMKDLLHFSKNISTKQGVPVTGANGGGAAAMVELFSNRKVTLSVEIPEQVIILDPWISEKDETYTRIVQRYKDILQTYRTGRDSTTSALFRLSLSSLREENEVSDIKENASHINPDDVQVMDFEGEEVLKHSKGDNGVNNDHPDKKSLSLGENSTTPKNNGTSFNEQINDVEMESTSQTDSSRNLNIDSTGITVSPMLTDEVLNANNSNNMKHHLESNNTRKFFEATELASGLHKLKPGTCDEPGQTRTSKAESHLLIPGESPNVTQNLSKELDYRIYKKNSGDVDNISKLDKTINNKWSRLDFEWVSDKEWDADVDVSECTVEESDEVDGVDDDRIQGDYINLEGEAVDGEEATPNNQQTLVARAATRIALFMMKEEMDESTHVNNKQHAHDFFVVNSCSVFCHSCEEETGESSAAAFVPPSDSKMVSPKRNILPLTQREVDEVLNRIKSAAIIDLHQSGKEDALEATPEFYHPCVKAVINYVESKKNLGVTISQIKSFYEGMEMEKLQLPAVISLLVKHHVLFRTGVTIPRYVHLQYMWPWLAHTFKFLRLDREKVAPCGLQMINCSNEDNDESIVNENNIINFENQQNTESKTLCSAEKSLEMEIPSTMQTLPTNISEHTFSSNDSKTVNLLPADLDKTSKKYDDEIDEKRNSAKIISNVCKGDNHADESKIKPPDAISSERKEDSEAAPSGKKSSSRKSRQSATAHPMGSVVCSKDMRKTTQGFPVNEKDEIHVFIRPWIRINGSLNKRVLDRLLGAVLGQAMYQPGQPLQSFGLRFQPALQPVHTRELIEVLHKIGCVKLLVRQQKQNVTLFSKPRPVVLVDADGTEDEKEIIVEPAADAICRLGQFIGEKSYSQDFMAAQEQLFAGRGSSEKTTRKKKNIPEDIINGSETDKSPYNSEKNEQSEIDEIWKN